MPDGCDSDCLLGIGELVEDSIRADPQGHDAMLAMHPIGRFGKPEEIAAVVLFLCSPGAGFTTGIAMPVDGGWTAQ